MINKIGFACLSKKQKINFKTFRLNSFSDKLMFNIIKNNLIELDKMLKYVNNNYSLYRLSSTLIPFASHNDIMGINYIKYFENEFNYIKKQDYMNNIELSIHAQPMVNIHSFNNEVIQNSIKELEYYNLFMNMLGINNYNLVMHIGGAYNDKRESIKKFINNFTLLPNEIKNNIKLENDDKIYNVNDLYNVYEYIGTPIIFDWHHHLVNFYDFDIDKIFSTWNTIPKIHLSSPRKDNIRAHNDYIDYEYVKPILKYNINVMVEAKEKDLAVDQLIFDIKNNKI